MSPADLVIGALRNLQMPFPTPQQFEAQYRVWRDVYWLISYAGQELLNPPNVAGWPAYYQFPSYDEVWLDSATYPARKNSLLGIIYIGFSTGNNLFQPQSRNLEFKVDLLALVDQFTNPHGPQQPGGRCRRPDDRRARLGGRAQPAQDQLPAAGPAERLLLDRMPMSST